MNSQIVLIRHGITTGNINRLYYGSTDVPLAEEGVQRLKELKEKGIYPDRETARLYTSGMLRTEQTFELIYGDRPHEQIPQLQELAFGDFEMKKYEELKDNPEYMDWIAGNDTGKAPPNGESLADFAERIEKGFEIIKEKHMLEILRLRNKGQEAMSICVCHGGVISGIMAKLWPEEEKTFFDWIPDPGHGYIIDFEEGKHREYSSF